MFWQHSLIHDANEVFATLKADTEETRKTFTHILQVVVTDFQPLHYVNLDLTAQIINIVIPLCIQNRINAFTPLPENVLHFMKALFN